MWFNFEDGTRPNENWLMRPKDANGPVLLAFHTSRASACTVALVEKLKDIQIYTRWVMQPTYFAQGSVSPVMLRLTPTAKTGCSVRFFPTLGRSRMEGIPTFSSAFLSPIPEWSKICGVPILPPARITSFVAVKVFLGDVLPDSVLASRVNTHIAVSHCFQR